MFVSDVPLLSDPSLEILTHHMPPDDVRRLAIHLGVKNPEIEHIQADHRGNSKLVCFKMMLAWRRNAGKFWSHADTLLKAVKEIELISIAEIIKKAIDKKRALTMDDFIDI